MNTLRLFFVLSWVVASTTTAAFAADYAGFTQFDDSEAECPRGENPPPINWDLLKYHDDPRFPL